VTEALRRAREIHGADGAESTQPAAGARNP
jgi:hypothetical protein